MATTNPSETDRNYTDGALRTFAGDLDDGEQKMLVQAGALPAEPFLSMEPAMTSQDVARMIQLVKDEGEEVSA